MDNNYSSNNNYNYSNENNYNYTSNNYYQSAGADVFGGIKEVSINKVMVKVFSFMFVALLITAFAALTTSIQVAAAILNGGGFMVLIIAEIAIVLISNRALSKNNVVLATILYTVYSFLTGMTMSVIFWVYTAESIVNVFFIAAGVFAFMAVVGITTKVDLSKVGTICMMGLFGIIIAGIINIFVRSAMFDFAISSVAIVIFIGLTAYDMQKIKRMAAFSTQRSENAIALYGAFELYLDFINLFLRLLRLFGKRK